MKITTPVFKPGMFEDEPFPRIVSYETLESTILDVVSGENSMPDHEYMEIRIGEPAKAEDYFFLPYNMNEISQMLPAFHVNTPHELIGKKVHILYETTEEGTECLGLIPSLDMIMLEK